MGRGIAAPGATRLLPAVTGHTSLPLWARLREVADEWSRLSSEVQHDRRMIEIYGLPERADTILLSAAFAMLMVHTPADPDPVKRENSAVAAEAKKVVEDWRRRKTRSLSEARLIEQLIQDVEEELAR